MKKTILLIACIAIATSVQARMGYTKKQCIQQYGSAVEVSGKDRDSFTFKKNGFNIRVWFDGEELVKLIMYTRPGEFGKKAIYETEREHIVQLNADGYTWATMECPREYRDQHIMNSFWRRSDGALAFYNATTYELAILPAGFDDVVFKPGSETTSGL